MLFTSLSEEFVWKNDWLEVYNHGQLVKKVTALDSSPAKDARVKCLEIGADLVLPTNDEENQELIRILDWFEIDAVHLRASDVLSEGQWLDLATGKQISYSDWKPGQPDNWQGTEHYAALNGDWSLERIVWNDIMWHTQAIPLCQKTPTPGMTKKLDHCFSRDIS